MGIGIGLVEEEEEEEMGVLVVRRERWMSGKIVNLGGCHHHGCTMSSSWPLSCFVGLDFLERENMGTEMRTNSSKEQVVCCVHEIG